MVTVIQIEISSHSLNPQQRKLKKIKWLSKNRKGMLCCLKETDLLFKFDSLSLVVFPLAIHTIPQCISGKNNNGNN